ncbi:MAG: T9SS type A sorting domain-containing protein [Bacteroidetes bacterium]|nr:T9SS type A sorting domain-containing protein [Bacteroidota bacterium]
MKRTSPLLLLLLLFTVGMLNAAFGQNYRPFSNGNIHRFDSPSGFYSIKVDSATEVAADSVFWFNKIVVPVSDSFPGNNCGYPWWQGPAYSYGNENLLGTKMLEKANGEFQFIAETGDTIFIQTQVPLLSSWTFHSDSSLTAIISSRTLETFHGQVDSVVTIAISNGEELRISKNHGVLTVHNFNAYWSSAPVTVYQQRSLPAKPNYLDFYDFEVGDQFRFFEASPVTGSPGWTHYHDGFEVLGRQNYPNGDSIRYFVARSLRRRGELANSLPFDSVMPTDTITWMFRRETLNWYVDGGNAQHYTIGLGQTLDGTYANVDRERELICYVKQTDSVAPCAIPLVNIPEPQANEMALNIFPNPFTESTTLQFANPRGLRHVLTVSNMTGQVVQEITEIVGDHILLERGELPSGLYFFVLKSADGHAGTGKLLVK